MKPPPVPPVLHRQKRRIGAAGGIDGVFEQEKKGGRKHLVGRSPRTRMPAL